MLKAGSLNRRVTIQMRQAGKLPGGQPVDTWVDFAKVWANIGGKTGLRAITEQQGDVPASVAQYSIRIRYRTTVTSDMRVVDDNGVIYEIILVQSDNFQREWTDLICRQGANDG